MASIVSTSCIRHITFTVRQDVLYTTRDISAVVYPASHISITRTREEALRDEVHDRIIDGVPSAAYDETSEIAPFRYDTSRATIAAALYPFTTGEPRTNAVYVLECLQNRTPAGTALRQGVSSASISRYQSAGDARRVLYVGVAQNVLDRIDQHLNYPGREGANFTALYPPVRILQVGWFTGKRTAEDAERLTATLLRNRFPDDFVAYPG